MFLVNIYIFILISLLLSERGMPNNDIFDILTGFKKEALLNLMGEFYFDYIRKLGHDELLRNLGASFKDFLENLDYVHTYMMSEYPEMSSPSFRLQEDEKDEKLFLHYYSFRKGFHPLVVGL